MTEFLIKNLKLRIKNLGVRIERVGEVRRLLPVVEKIELLISGEIVGYRYDEVAGRIVLR